LPNELARAEDAQPKQAGAEAERVKRDEAAIA